MVGTEVERSVVAPPGLQAFFDQVIDMLDDTLGNNNPTTFSQTAFFQTKSPPADLRPYVKWISPTLSHYLIFFPTKDPFCFCVRT